MHAACGKSNITRVNPKRATLHMLGTLSALELSESRMIICAIKIKARDE